MKKEAQLNVPLADRFRRGVFPLLEQLECTLTREQMDKVIRCMNSAFDAGQVEALKARGLM